MESEANMRESLHSLPTFAAIVEHAIDNGATSRKALAYAAGVDDESVRRWLLSRQLPKLLSFRQMIGDTSIPQVLRDALVHWFHHRSGFRAVPVEQTDRSALDVNGDRAVDARDAIHHAAKAMKQGGEALEQLLVGMCDGRLDQMERERVRVLLHEQQRAVLSALETLDYNDRASMRLTRAGA